MSSDLYQQSPQNGFSNYTFPGILHYLQMEWRRFEKERTEWEIEKSDLKARLSFLEGERRGIENLKVDLLRRVKMLEYALRQERVKYLQLQQKLNNSNNITSVDSNEDIKKNSTPSLPNSNTNSTEIQTNTAAQTTEEQQNINSPTPMSGNSLLLYSKGCGTLRSREILKAYLLEVGYWNPLTGSNNNSSININDNRGIKHLSTDMSSPTTPLSSPSISNLQNQRSLRTSYTPVTQMSSSKEKLSVSLKNEAGQNGNDYLSSLKKKMSGKKKKSPISKEIFEPLDDNENNATTNDTNENENSVKNENIEKNDNKNIEEEIKNNEKTKNEEDNNKNKNNQNSTDENMLFQTDNLIPSKQLNKVLKASKVKDKKRSKVGSGKKDSFTFGNEVYNFDGEEMEQSLTKGSLKQNEDKLWRPKLTLKNHLDTVRSLSFHNTEKIMISGSDDGTAKLWNLEFLGNSRKNMIDVDPIYTYRGHTGPILSVDISDNICYTGSTDSTIRSWKIPPKNMEPYSKYDPTIQQHQFVGHTDAVWCVKTHPIKDQYQILASAAADGTVKLWNTDGNYELKSTIDYNGLSNGDKPLSLINPTSLNWLNTDLGKLIVSYQNSIVKLFDTETGSEFMTLPSSETYDNTPATQINYVISHPTMPLIITAHEDRYIRFFDIKSGECINSMTAHLDGVTSLSIHPSGLSFASGGHDSSIRIWDISTKNCIQEMSSHRKKFDEGVWCVKYHPTATSILASCGGDSTCKIYSLD